MNATKQVQFFIGLNFDKNGKELPEAQVERAINAFTARLTEKYDGCTLAPAVGRFAGFPEEEVAVVTVISDTLTEEAIKDDAIFIREALNQQAVFVALQDILAELI